MLKDHLIDLSGFQYNIGHRRPLRNSCSKRKVFLLLT